MTYRAPLRLRVDEELRFLLPQRRRGGAFDVSVDGTSTLGHVVQSVGVPLTEVGLLTVDGAPAEPSYRPVGGEVASVGVVSRPQPMPARARFLLDVHLGSLARRLRLLGVDTSYDTDAEDDELAERALEERRVLLTQDRGLLQRTALRGTAAYVRGTGGDEQLRDVLDRFAPALSPYTRCLACNGKLVDVAKSEVEPLLQPGTRRTYDEFRQCPECGRVYWRGAHAARLATVVDEARRWAVDSRSRGGRESATMVRQNDEEAR